ncbi:MAG: P27 family phage terminase small subunit [Gammaproteobacteria bacterium]
MKFLFARYTTASEQMLKLMGEFGMTPSSRTRVRTTDKKIKDPIAEELFGF